MKGTHLAKREEASNVPLFRREALARYRADAGESLVLTPPSVTALTWFFLIAAMSIVAFLFTFDYARRVKASGRLMTTEGVVRIYPSVEGVITRRLVSDGDKVVAGQPLFALSADKKSNVVGSIAEGVLRQLNRRSETIAEDTKRTLVLRARDKDALIKKVAFLEQEARETALQVASQEKAVATSDDYLKKFKELAAQGFTSEALLQEKEQANIDAKTRLHQLLREASTVAQNLHDAQTELANFAGKVENEVNALKREASSLEQDTVETESRREVVVYASIPGTVTGVLADAGQIAPANQVLASIVPENARFYLQLNIPTAAAGLVSNSERVLVRYSSFPYERFGQFGGRIMTVAETALSASELKMNEDTKDLFYPARVELDNQFVDAYGRRIQLREGMLADADILLEKRKLIDWFIEPLLAARSRYGSPAGTHAIGQ